MFTKFTTIIGAATIFASSALAAGSAYVTNDCSYPVFVQHVDQLGSSSVVQSKFKLLLDFHSLFINTLPQSHQRANTAKQSPPTPVSPSRSGLPPTPLDHRLSSTTLSPTPATTRVSTTPLVALETHLPLLPPATVSFPAVSISRL